MQGQRPQDVGGYSIAISSDVITFKFRIFIRWAVVFVSSLYLQLPMYNKIVTSRCLYVRDNMRGLFITSIEV